MMPLLSVCWLIMAIVVFPRWALYATSPYIAIFGNVDSWSVLIAAITEREDDYRFANAGLNITKHAWKKA